MNYLCKLPIFAAIIVLVKLFSVGVARKEVSVDYTDHELIHNKQASMNYKEEIKIHQRSRRGAADQTSTFKNITIIDHHKYYTSQFIANASKLWIDIDNMKGAKRHEHLSTKSLSKATVKMSFDFPYYGHLIRTFTATSGGFLNLGMSTQRLITQVQYVAPLMAYFNPQLTPAASVSSYDDGNQFIVQWTKVRLNDNFNAGPFTFQCILKKNGTMMFIYKKIPISVQNISSAKHPVTVGVSDSFHIDHLQVLFGRFFRVRTHYIYDKVTLDVNQITNSSAYILHPKPSCITAKSCDACIDRRMNTNFNCTWCFKIGRCSDGLDRKHREWNVNKCFQSSGSTKEQCSLSSRTIVGMSKKTSPGPSGGVIAAIVIVLLLVPLLIFGAIVLYAYIHPTSPAGLYLIEHNPRKWFRKQEQSNVASYSVNSVPKKVLT